VEDRTPPFVLRVDLNALPNDAGLPREFYADLFTSATDYTGHSAYWTLASPVVGPVVFNNGGSHLIDYDISTGIRVEDSTSVTMAPGVRISWAALHGGSYITINGGIVQGDITADSGCGIILNDGAIGAATVWDSFDGFTMNGGTIGSLEQLWGNVRISGGNISNAYLYDGQADISGGMIGSMTLSGSTGIGITGGRVEEKLILEQKSFGAITGGSIIPTIEVVSEAELRLYGELTLTERVTAGQYSYYTRQASGTLRDGTPIDSEIKCQFYPMSEFDIDNSCDRVFVFP
jgi:hypothetical protein